MSYAFGLVVGAIVIAFPIYKMVKKIKAQKTEEHDVIDTSAHHDRIESDNEEDEQKHPEEHELSEL